MNKKDAALLGGLGLGAFSLGALTMFLMDPKRGRRRRALARGRLARATHEVRDGVSGTMHDLRNRARGLLAETRAEIEESDVPDEVLIERVRSALGHVVPHAGRLELNAYHGNVKIRGQVPEDEKPGLLRTVRRVRGVEQVEDMVGTWH